MMFNKWDMKLFGGGNPKPEADPDSTFYYVKRYAASGGSNSANVVYDKMDARGIKYGTVDSSQDLPDGATTYNSASEYETALGLSNINFNQGNSHADWNLTGDEKKVLFAAIKNNGGPLTDQQLLSLNLINKSGNSIGSARFDNVKDYQKVLIDNNASLLGFDYSGQRYEADGSVDTTPLEGAEVTDPREQMYNQYYNDIFSLEEGTIGKKLLDNNTSLYQKEAENAGIIARAGAQSQALAQASSIKQITDQVRAERMAQLRAGMSESQLADRELQMLMGSVGQLNQATQMADQGALEAELGGTTAREYAFNDYMKDAQVLAQSGAANYASQVGDLLTQAIAYRNANLAAGRNITLEQAKKEMAGEVPTTT